MLIPPTRILVGHKRLTGLDDHIRAARPDLDVRAQDLDTIDDAALAWAECYVGFRRPKPASFGGVRWIHCVGAGVDAYILPPVPDGIVLTRTSEDFGPQIAEYCAARALAITQEMRKMDAAQRERRWEPDYPRPFAGSRALVVGTGHVGGAVARTFAALGAHVTGASRSGRPAAGFERVARVSQLRELVGEAQWIVLCAPLTADSRGLVSRELLDQCKGAVLMNVGRGALADEGAIPGALDRGTLRAAVLDVFEREPLPADSPLWARADVYLTPHISGLTTLEGAAAGFLECLDDFEHGRTPAWLVDQSRGY